MQAHMHKKQGCGRKSHEDEWHKIAMHPTVFSEGETCQYIGLHRKGITTTVARSETMM